MRQTWLSHRRCATGRRSAPGETQGRLKVRVEPAKSQRRGGAGVARRPYGPPAGGVCPPASMPFRMAPAMIDARAIRPLPFTMLFLGPHVHARKGEAFDGPIRGQAGAPTVSHGGAPASGRLSGPPCDEPCRWPHYPSRRNRRLASRTGASSHALAVAATTPRSDHRQTAHSFGPRSDRRYSNQLRSPRRM